MTNQPGFEPRIFNSVDKRSIIVEPRVRHINVLRLGELQLRVRYETTQRLEPRHAAGYRLRKSLS